MSNSIAVHVEIDVNSFDVLDLMISIVVQFLSSEELFQLMVIAKVVAKSFCALMSFSVCNQLESPHR